MDLKQELLELENKMNDYLKQENFEIAKFLEFIDELDIIQNLIINDSKNKVPNQKHNISDVLEVIQENNINKLNK